MYSIRDLHAQSGVSSRSLIHDNTGTYLFPFGDLFFVPDPRYVVVAAGKWRDESRLRDHERARHGRPLGVVRLHVLAGDMVLVRTEASEWCEHDTVREGVFPNDRRLEELGDG